MTFVSLCQRFSTTISWHPGKHIRLYFHGERLKKKSSLFKYVSYNNISLLLGLFTFCRWESLSCCLNVWLQPMLFWGCTPFPDLMFSSSQQGSQVWEWPGNDIYVFVKRLQGVDYKEMLEREKNIS